MEEKISLERFLVLSGQGNRRYCAWLVRQNRVRVNQKAARDPKKKISILSNVTCDDERVKMASLATWMIHKPPGFVCQTGEETPALLSLVPAGQGLGLVGRLDKDSEGLILATNDGDLSHQLTHPEFHVPRTYEVDVTGTLTTELFEKLCSGLPLDNKPTRPLEGHILQSQGQRTKLKLVLAEGKKRQIRRLCDLVGLHVNRLIRTHFGPLGLGTLESGVARQLNSTELTRLRGAVAARKNEGIEDLPE